MTSSQTQTPRLHVDPDATLRSIMEGTATAKGDHFFRSLVQYLAVSLNVKRPSSPSSTLIGQRC